jgi:hypothetical protein
MPYFVEIPLSNGETILAEVTGQVEDLAPVGSRSREIVGRLPGALGDGLDRVQAFAGEVLSRMREYPQPPDRVSVEFGLTFSAKAGVYIAESTAEAHLTVTAEWSRPTVPSANGTQGSPMAGAAGPDAGSG